MYIDFNEDSFKYDKVLGGIINFSAIILLLAFFVSHIVTDWVDDRKPFISSILHPTDNEDTVRLEKLNTLPTIFALPHTLGIYFKAYKINKENYEYDQNEFRPLSNGYYTKIVS